MVDKTTLMTIGNHELISIPTATCSGIWHVILKWPTWWYVPTTMSAIQSLQMRISKSLVNTMLFNISIIETEYSSPNIIVCCFGIGCQLEGSGSASNDIFDRESRFTILYYGNEGPATDSSVYKNTKRVVMAIPFSLLRNMMKIRGWFLPAAINHREYRCCSRKRAFAYHESSLLALNSYHDGKNNFHCTVMHIPLMVRAGSMV